VTREHHEANASVGRIPAASAAVAAASDFLQGLLILCVVGWVLDLPRRLFGWSFYTEQLLAICLGLGLALSFIGGKPRRPAAFDWSGVITSAAILVYAFWQYDTFAQVPVPLIVCLVLALAWTAVGSRVWAIRWFDLVAAAASLIICGYIAVRYEALTYEIAMLPTEGVVGSAILLLLVIEATRRSSGGRAGRDHPRAVALCLYRPVFAG